MNKRGEIATKSASRHSATKIAREPSNNIVVERRVADTLDELNVVYRVECFGEVGSQCDST